MYNKCYKKSFKLKRKDIDSNTNLYENIKFGCKHLYRYESLYVMTLCPQLFLVYNLKEKM